MKRRPILLLVLGVLTLAGCSSEFLGGGATGAAAGVAGAGAGYELHAHRRMEQLKKDLDAGRITEQEYEVRKSEIEKGSVFY